MSDAQVIASDSTNGSAKRGRGRPKKDTTAAPKPEKPVNNGVASNGDNDSDSEPSAPAPKKRGRKPAANKPNKELKTTDGPKRGRGRPPKKGSPAKGKAKAAAGAKGKRGRKPAKKAESSEEEADDANESGSEEEKEEEEASDE